jgi:predicted transcriptional regulator
MRKLAVSALFMASTIFLPFAEAESTPIHFDTPAQIIGKVGVSAEWALILLSPGSQLDGTLVMPETIGVTNFTQYSTLVRDESQTGQEAPLVPPSIEEKGPLPSLSASIRSQSEGSVFIQGRIRFEADDLKGELIATDGKSCLANFVTTAQYHRQSARFQNLCPVSSVLVGLQGHDNRYGSIVADDVSVFESHNVLICSEKSCWGSNDREEHRQNLYSGLSLDTRTLRFHEFQSQLGNVRLRANGIEVLLGGANMDLHGFGTARLPMVGGTCSECTNQTWTIRGSFGLTNLTGGQGGGLLKADYSGQLQSLRLDEANVPVPPLAGILGATALVTISTLLKFLIAPFFTRLSKDQALEHPRRKQIFDYVQKNPGTNFREISRKTGIAAGTVRHHLNVLERSDLLVERQHGSTIRLFENHGKYDRNWADMVLLREAVLATLYGWLKEHPNSPQKAVLEGMEAHGWSRSTTQHRLARLVDGGLVSIRLQGRLKIYSPSDSSPIVAARPMASAAPA